MRIRAVLSAVLAFTAVLASARDASALQRLDMVPRGIAGVPSPVAAPVPGGMSLGVSLEEAVALGLRQNRTIRAAYLQRAVERFDLHVAERAFVPVGNVATEVVRRRDGNGDIDVEMSVSPSGRWRSPLGASASFVWDRRETIDGGTGGARENLSIQLRQPLLKGAGWDVNMAPVRIARLQEDINRLRLKATVSDTVTAVVFAYRSLIQAQEQVRLAELSLERTRALLATNRMLVEAGRMAAADIVQTESGVANQEVALLDTQRRRATAQVALMRLLALDPRTNVVATDDVAAQRVDVDLELAIDLALQARADILAQRKSIEQMRQASIVTRNSRLWDISIVGSLNRLGGDWGPGVLDGHTEHAIGLRLDIPIGDYSPRRADLAATTSLRTAELYYEDLTAAAEAQIRDAVQTADSAWRQLEAARRARDLAEQALSLQQEKLRVGRASNFEVLSFQSDLRAADIQELSARIAYLNTLTALDQQIGSTLETWRISLND